MGIGIVLTKINSVHQYLCFCLYKKMNNGWSVHFVCDINVVGTIIRYVVGHKMK
jgi:hypothetical protein